MKFENIMQAIENNQPDIILQLLGEAEPISIPPGSEGDLYYLLNFAIQTGNISIIEEFFKKKHLRDAFIRKYLIGEMSNNFLNFIYMLSYMLSNAIESPESQLSSLKVIKIINDGFLTYVNKDEAFPNITELTQTGYILHQNQLHFYDQQKGEVKLITVYDYEHDALDVLDFFSQTSIEKLSIEQFLDLDSMLPIEENDKETYQNSSSKNIAPISKKITSTLVNFDYQRFKNHIPTRDDFSFSYKKKASKSQNAIINQVSQYLQLKNKTDYIPKIQDGICAALTHLFDEMPLEKWEELNKKLLEWDGTQENLDRLNLSTDLEKLFSYIIKYQFEDLKTRPYFYINMSFNFDALLEKMGEESVFFINAWHQIVLKKTENNSFLVYDPNYKSGFLETKIADEVKSLLKISLGNNILGFSQNDLKIPSSAIDNGNAFIQEGGLLLAFAKGTPDLLSELPQRKDIEKDCLTGLVLRNNAGIPMWACPTNDKQLLNYLNELAMEFMVTTPDFKSEFKKSLEAISNVWVRRLGLDFLYDIYSDQELVRKISDIYKSNPEKINLHKSIISICEKNINTIENSFKDPVVLSFFYDLMHSFQYFTSRWESVKNGETLHLKNPVQKTELIICVSDENPKERYFKIVDNENKVKEFSIPDELQGPLSSIIKNIPPLYKNTPALSYNHSLYESFRKKSKEQSSIKTNLEKGLQEDNKPTNRDYNKK